MSNPLDEVARQNPEMARAVEELRQHARELAPEAANFEEFAEMFGLGSTCERCGRTGLDDEDYTDCDVDESDALVCHECLSAQQVLERAADLLAEDVPNLRGATPAQRLMILVGLDNLHPFIASVTSSRDFTTFGAQARQVATLAAEMLRDTEATEQAEEKG